MRRILKLKSREVRRLTNFETLKLSHFWLGSNVQYSILISLQFLGAFFDRTLIGSVLQGEIAGTYD